MLSNDAFKLLKWLEKSDKWMTKEEIAKGHKSFDDRSFRAITQAGYVESRLSESEESWAEHRISDAGKAYLEGARYAKTQRHQEWISLLFSAIALVISVISEIT